MNFSASSLVNRDRARLVALGIAAFLIVAPCLSIATQALMLISAHVLTWSAELLLQFAIPRLPVDPVYAQALIYNVGHIDPRGLAVAGPVGDTLHGLWPHAFAASDYAQDGTVASAVMDGSSTVAAAMLARMGAAIPLLSAAMLLASLRRVPRWAVITCLLLQAQVLIDLAPELALVRSEIEAAGIPFAVAALLPVSENGQRVFFTRGLDSLPDWIVGALAALIFSVVTILVSCGCAALTRLVARATARRFHRARPSNGAAVHQAFSWRFSMSLSAAALMFVLVMTVTPLRAFSETEPVFLDQDSPLVDSELMMVSPASEPAQEAGPSVVQLERNGDQFSLRVNGHASFVKGVGYNPWYAELELTQRQALYGRDFAQIRATGANMLEGWFEQQFDEVTLDAAQANGLGVIMPFELNQDYDYSDPAVQARFLEQLTAWVQRYKAHPAVRMWAPGNEVLHRLIYPTLVRGSVDPDMELRAEDFAAFYVKVIDRIHELDPNHPVLYRDAEDGYVGRLATELRRDGVARPWLIYGANVYTPRIREIVRDWSAQTLNAPILVSEFAATGMSAQDRPRRMEWFWKVIRSRPSMVLGGVVYTWSTNGPEDLDRVFGLTDSNGQPVDGSVDALSRMFQSRAVSR